MRKERAKIEAERAEADRIIREAREAQDRAEAADRAKAAAAQAQQEADEREARAQEDAPDAAKLREVAERLRTFELPAVGPRAVSVIARIREANVKAAAWIEQQAAVLKEVRSESVQHTGR